MANPVRYTDPAVNRFAKTNLYYETDPLIAFQDPTFLGFKFLFLFDQANSGLLSTVSHTDTAMGFLERIGETDRAYYLSQFVDLLRNINGKTPWFFQTIGGLDEAWKRKMGMEDFTPKIKDRKIEIGCLESIDLRITAMMDLYRKACFDHEFGREIVPWNLRTFTTYVYIYEIREINRFASPTNDVPEANTRQQEMNDRMLGKFTEFAATDTGAINPNINRILFRFDQCEFLPDDSGDFLASVSNSSHTAASQKISFSYRFVVEENLYNMFSDRVVADETFKSLNLSATDNPDLLSGYEINNGNPTPGIMDPKGFRDKIKERFQQVKDAAKKQVENLGSVFDEETVLQQLQDQAFARANGLVSSQIGRALLGNVYGLSLDGLANAASGGIVQLATQAVRLGQEAGASVSNGISQASGQIFNPSTQNELQTASGNDLDGADNSSELIQEIGPINGASTSNDTSGISELQEDGPSGDNTIETAGGNIEEGDSTSNITSTESGSIDTTGVLNPIGTASGTISDGTSITNTVDAASGNIANGISVSNTTGNADGQITDGTSVSNTVVTVNGQLTDGSSPSNTTSDVSGQIQPGESIANTTGNASGQIADGKSIENIVDEASGTLEPGKSEENSTPNKKEKLPTITDGESAKNRVTNDKSVIESGKSEENRETEIPANSSIEPGPSKQNRISDTNGNIMPITSNNVIEMVKGTIEEGRSIQNVVSGSEDSVEIGPSRNNILGATERESIEAGNSVNNIAKRPLVETIESGASLSNKGIPKVDVNRESEDPSMSNIIQPTSGNIHDVQDTKHYKMEAQIIEEGNSISNSINSNVTGTIEDGSSINNSSNDVIESIEDGQSLLNRIRGVEEQIEAGNSINNEVVGTSESLESGNSVSNVITTTTESIESGNSTNNVITSATESIENGNSSNNQIQEENGTLENGVSANNQETSSRSEFNIFGPDNQNSLTPISGNIFDPGPTA